MDQYEWERNVIQYMTKGGWINDTNNEKTLGFSFKDTKGDTWIRDYNKSTRGFIQYNGDHKINLRSIKHAT